VKVDEVFAKFFEGESMGLPKVSRLVGLAMVVAAAVVGDLAVVVAEPQEVIRQNMFLGIFIACDHYLNVI
jgi:hypothetical protein